MEAGDDPERNGLDVGGGPETFVHFGSFPTEFFATRSKAAICSVSQQVMSGF